MTDTHLEHLKEMFKAIALQFGYYDASVDDPTCNFGPTEFIDQFEWKAKNLLKDKSLSAEEIKKVWDEGFAEGTQLWKEYKEDGKWA